MTRREFPASVRVAIIRRATLNGTICCEACGLVGPKTWHVDHTIPDALYLDKARTLTADDGKVLCAGEPGSCHSEKTGIDQGDIARAKRQEAKHLRAKPIGPQPTLCSAPMPTTPKAAKRAARGSRPALKPRLPQGFVPATEY